MEDIDTVYERLKDIYDKLVNKEKSKEYDEMYIQSKNAQHITKNLHNKIEKY